MAVFKKAINLNHLRIFTFAIAGAAILVVNLFMSHIALNRITRVTEEQHTESCELSALGYTTTIEVIIQNKIKILDFHASVYKKKQADTDITQFLKESNLRLDNQFHSMIFVDTKRNCYSGRTGRIWKFSDDFNFDRYIDNDSLTFVSQPFYSRDTGEPVIAIGKKIYNEDNSLKGLLCATVSLDSLYDEFSAIKIKQSEHFIVQNQNGTLIYHPDHNLINKTLKAPKIKVLKSDNNDEKLMLSGHVKVKSFDGSQNMYVFFNKIDNTDWYLGLSIPESEYSKIEKLSLSFTFMIVFISVLTIILLTALETLISNYFRKKDLIATDYDSLTNLYTRERFEVLASRILRRNNGDKFVLFEADIHGFKFINQNYGVEKADKLIVYYADMLKSFTEKHDGIIGRGYADHFYALFKISSVHKAKENFIAALNEMNEKISEYEISFFPKFGLAFHIPKPEKGNAVQIKDLIGQASFAKSTLKDNILTYYAIYDSKLLEASNKEHLIESHMEQALADGEFFVMYQPKMDLKTNKIVGAEALVRWNSSLLGLLPPNDFIPLFERNDFVKQLDFFVYEQVFKFLRKCMDEGKPVVPVSINMSRNHSKPEDFLATLLTIFSKYNLPTELIEIEILERSIMDRTTLKNTCMLLHAEGFKVAMDDFGSGESSLNMLTTIPVDILKFDKSFLDNACPKGTTIPDSQGSSLIEGLIMLSKQLNKKTLFEGVETQAQLNLLKQLNCDLIQGFLYAKPLSEDDFVEFIQEHI